MSTLDVSFLAIHGPTRPCTDTQILHICRLILTSISSFKGKEQGRCDLLQSNLNICFICDTSTRNGFGVISCHFESCIFEVVKLITVIKSYVYIHMYIYIFIHTQSVQECSSSTYTYPCAGCLCASGSFSMAEHSFIVSYPLEMLYLSAFCMYDIKLLNMANSKPVSCDDKKYGRNKQSSL